MEFKDTKILTRAEFGSTYKGLSDKHSDEDVFYIVYQPLEDTVFKPLKSGVKHSKEEGFRAYSLERFISLVLNGSYDSMLLFSSQLETNKETKLNKEVFGDFYKEELKLIDALLRDKSLRYASSLLGMVNQFKTKLEKEAMADTYGKSMLNLVDTLNKAKHFLDKVGTDYVFQLEDVVRLTKIGAETIPTKELVKCKRFTKEEWETTKETKALIEPIKELILEVEQKYRTAKFKDGYFRYEKELKERVIKFLIEEYKNS